MGNPNVDPSNIAIVNANYDTTNIVSLNDTEIRERLIKTLQTCIDLMASHCGPLSSYALLVAHQSLGEESTPSIFTRDGIDIMNSVKFMSPLEHYIQELLAYIGLRVDDNAKDGTTTSMFLAASLMQGILEHKDEFQKMGLTIPLANRSVGDLFKEILDNLKEYTFTLQRISGAKSTEDFEKLTEEELAILGGKIAFMQTLSSSGGNIKLASAVKEIFEKSPRQTWEFITYHFAGRETSELYRVRQDPYDTRICCMSMTENDLDSQLNTEYERENVKVLIIDEPIVDGNPVYGALMDTYLPKLDKDQAFAIIAPHVDARLVTTVNALNLDRSKQGHITIWQYSAQERYNGKAYNWLLRIVIAICGADKWDGSKDRVIEDRHIITAKKLWWHDTFLEFYGAVPEPEHGCLHPFYSHPEQATDFYNDAVSVAKKQIESYRTEHDKTGRLMGNFQEILNMLASVRRPMLVLGGTTHDQQASQPVAQDVLGATMSSLRHGFLINGPISLYCAIADTIKKRKNVPEGTRAYTDLILQIFLKSLEDIIKIVYPSQVLPFVKNGTFSIDKNRYLNSLEANSIVGGKLKETYLYDFMESIDAVTYDVNENKDGKTVRTAETSYPVLQPSQISYELLRRMQELIIKFIHTDKIIVQGGVNVRKELLSNNEPKTEEPKEDKPVVTEPTVAKETKSSEPCFEDIKPTLFELLKIFLKRIVDKLKGAKNEA